MGSSGVLTSQLSTLHSHKNTAMKHKSILSLLIFLMSFGMFTTSCEDMLTPDMNRYATEFSGRDSVYFYLGIVRNVQDMVEQNQLLGDLRSDLVTGTEYSSENVSDIIDYKHQTKDGENDLLNRAAYYKVINQCNYYLAKVDTFARKNDLYYMKREYAQVVNIRAWTYLQLVQTYGEVPFITAPVDNADTGWERTAPKANADNLVDLLRGDLEKAQVIENNSSLGYPQYGEFNSGNSNFKVKSQYLLFYSDIILGDLYLLRGKDKNDYVEAAKAYYDFLKKKAAKNVNITSARASFAQNQNTNGTYWYNPGISAWVANGLGATALKDENITIVPSAANSTFGQILTKVASVYGFDAHSTNTTTSGSSSSSATTSGSLTVTPNYKSRQVGPSNAYLVLNQSQLYSNTQTTGNEATSIKYYDGAGDARMYATVPYIQTTEGRFRYIVKDAPTTSVTRDGITREWNFKHYKSIYRLNQIYLRYAEAINRAGYPSLAFMILRNGINHEYMPTIGDSIRYDDQAKTKQTVYYTETSNVARACKYVDINELRRAKEDPQYNLYLNFTSSDWNGYGIHEHGCGATSTLDSLYNYSTAVATRIKEEALRSNTLTASVRHKINKLLREGEQTGTEEGGTEEGGEETPSIEEQRKDYTVIDPEPATEADPAEINAVESLIADEMALETAYEGTRMFDLIRIARHMNNDASLTADYGTKWLAWKIARRDHKYQESAEKPYSENWVSPIYVDPTDYDQSLYTKLLNPSNWYVVAPENN